MFDRYSTQYQEEHNVNLNDMFTPSRAILKKKKVNLSVTQLFILIIILIFVSMEEKAIWNKGMMT